MSDRVKERHVIALNGYAINPSLRYTIATILLKKITSEKKNVKRLRFDTCTFVPSVNNRCP